MDGHRVVEIECHPELLFETGDRIAHRRLGDGALRPPTVTLFARRKSSPFSGRLFSISVFDTRRPVRELAETGSWTAGRRGMRQRSWCSTSIPYVSRPEHAGPGRAISPVRNGWSSTATLLAPGAWSDGLRMTHLRHRPASILQPRSQFRHLSGLFEPSRWLRFPDLNLRPCSLGAIVCFRADQR
jgi:hypothetical protein